MFTRTMIMGFYFALIGALREAGYALGLLQTGRVRKEDGRLEFIESVPGYSLSVVRWDSGPSEKTWNPSDPGLSIRFDVPTGFDPHENDPVVLDLVMLTGGEILWQLCGESGKSLRTAWLDSVKDALPDLKLLLEGSGPSMGNLPLLRGIQLAVDYLNHGKHAA